MAINDMNQLLKHELGDLLYAERTFLKGLKKMSKEISDPMMKERVVSHAAETEEQIEVLGKAFESLGLKPRAEKCDAAIGLKEEHDSFKKEEKPSKALLEAFDLGNSLRVEHYEIAGYRSAIAVASVLCASECVALLTQSLREEEQMASFLERNAVKALKLLNTGMEFSEGKAEVLFTAETGSRRGGTAKSSKSGSSSARSGGSRSNGRSTADSGKSGGSSSGGKSSTASKSASKTASKSASKTASKSSSRSSGGSSSRTTAERSSSGGKSGGTAAKSSSKSGGSSSGSKSSGSKSGGSKSGGSRSGGSRSGGGARA